MHHDKIFHMPLHWQVIPWAARSNVEITHVLNNQFADSLGDDPMEEGQGYQAAREAGLRLLATTREALGSLDKVKRVVRIFGMVNSASGFGDQPKVINGCSDLMTEVFGEANGKGVRSAVGMAELPFGIPVEIEMILEVSN